MLQVVPWTGEVGRVVLVPRLSFGPGLVFQKRVRATLRDLGVAYELEHARPSAVGGTGSVGIDLHFTDAVAWRLRGGLSVWASHGAAVARGHLETGLAFAISPRRRR